MANQVDNGEIPFFLLLCMFNNKLGLKQSVDLDAISYTTKRTVKKRNSNNKRRSGANKKTKKQQQRVARRAEIIPFMDDDERKLDHLLGLGKAKPSSRTPQNQRSLTPFVSVGAFNQTVISIFHR